MTDNDNAVAMSGKEKALLVLSIIAAALSAVALAFALVMNVNIIVLRSGDMEAGEAIGAVLLLVFSAIFIACIVILALAGVVFYIFSRKSSRRSLKICATVTFVYHIAAVVLSIITFIIAICLINSGGT